MLVPAETLKVVNEEVNKHAAREGIKEGRILEAVQ
jgi:hypothetical protein